MNFKNAKWMRRDPYGAARWIANDCIDRLRAGKVSKSQLKKNAPIQMELKNPADIHFDSIEGWLEVMGDKYLQTKIHSVILRSAKIPTILHSCDNSDLIGLPRID